MMSRARDFRWSDRRVCVTGGAGFIGGWLVRALLADGASVVGAVRPKGRTSPILEDLRRKEFVLFETNLDDADALGRMFREHQIDTVFHLAANNENTDFSQSVLPIFESNVRATYHVLEACRLCAPQIKRLIIASSREANQAVDGDRPLHPYAASKRCAEIIARAFAESYGLPLGTVKSDNVYGGGDLNFKRLVPSVIKSLFEGNPPTLRQGASLSRGYIYVEDMVPALKLSAASVEDEARHGQTFSFQAEETVTAREMVDRIASIMGKDEITPVVAEATLRERVHVPEPALAYEEGLTWQPQVPLEKGLEATVAWYEAYFRRQRAPDMAPIQGCRDDGPASGQTNR